MNHAGANGAIVRALQAQGVDGIVAAGTGNGTLNTDLHAALLKAQAEGVRVMLASRCANGRLMADPREALAHSHGLSAVKARVAMMLDLLELPA